MALLQGIITAMTLDVITYPDPRLNQKCQKAVIGDKLKELIQNMLDTINSFKDPEAAGLSAIQVGVPVRVLIARDFSLPQQALSQQSTPQQTSSQQPMPRQTSSQQSAPEQVRYEHHHQNIIMINPKFVSLSKEEKLDWEGCLSFPNLYGKVWRAKKVKLKYQNLDGTEQRLTASGFLARVIQHEMDHLDGITFNTRIVGKMYKGEELEEGVKIAD